MKRHLILTIFVSLTSLSSFAANKSFLSCHTSEGALVLVNLQQKEASVAEVIHGAKGTHSIQRSGSVQGAAALGKAKKIQISDASGVIFSIASSRSVDDLSGFYIQSDGKSSSISCSP